jgi:hypothetical protein
VRENYTYRENVKPTMRLGYDSDVANMDLSLERNVLVGVTEFRNWRTLRVVENDFIGGEFLVSLELSPNGSTAAFDWRGNSYVSDPAKPSSGPRKAFFVARGAAKRALSFDEWRREMSLDEQSRAINTRATGTRVVVRPNAYEAGRAHIVVYNWDLESSVEADLSSVLRPGDRYEIRSVLDYFGQPVAQGVYGRQNSLLPFLNWFLPRRGRGRVTIPMHEIGPAAPVGEVPTRPRSTGRTFGVFVVRRR